MAMFMAPAGTPTNGARLSGTQISAEPANDVAQNEALRQSQTELEKSLDRYVDLCDSAPFGYLTLSSIGAITEINLTGAALLGACRSDLLHRPFAAFVVSTHGDAWQEFFARALRSSETQTCDLELPLRRGDDPVFQVALVCRLAKTPNSESMLRIAFWDISVQKQAAKEVHEPRREMARLVNQQVAVHTASAIAHELNQPLVAISAYSEAALCMLLGGASDREKLTHALEGAVEQAQRAGRIVHELVTFLRQGETRRERVDVNDAVREALAIVAECYSEFHPVLDLQRDLAPALANGLQVKKVLLNLVHNGIEAMREAGVPNGEATITVRTEAVAGMARVVVRDCGPGLGATVAPHIFGPGFSTKATGMGFGLAVSRVLVEAHGGQLWADLESGPGATFFFTLPFAP